MGIAHSFLNTTVGGSRAFLIFGILLSSLCHQSASADSRVKTISADSLVKISANCSFLLTNTFQKDKGDFRETSVADSPLTSRYVKFQFPLGRPPKGGWPAVLFFQGSFSPVKFASSESAPMGLNYEAQLVQDLLAAGYVVIAPLAIAGAAWQTNVPPFNQFYSVSSDYILIQNLLAAVEIGKFGAIAKNKIFATGISSGGYNASRVGIAFPNRFRALAIQSASYAKCLGTLCQIPEILPATHPPTLLITGAQDKIVPMATVHKYYKTLESNNIETDLWIEPNGNHGWFESSPQRIVDWFNNHLE